MKKPLVLLLAVASGGILGRVFDPVKPKTAAAEAARCSARNGDVNGDGDLGVTDAITLLGHLFLGDPTHLAPQCTAPAARQDLPDTGQTACHSEDGAVIDCASGPCAGQDGFYDTGCPSEGRFVDNDDGTVTDTCTGLMWQKDTADTNGDGRRDSSDKLTWCSALSYCESLELGDHADWRLPNARELQSIVDYGRFGPSIDPVFGALSSFYWSSTTHQAFRSVHAWGVYFHEGMVISNETTEDDVHLVRAVRSGP